MFLVVVFVVLHAIMSYFTRYVFYVFLFWALVNGRLTLYVLSRDLKPQSVSQSVSQSAFAL